MELIGNKPILPVSVVIPCYKCKQTILRAIRSIVNQTTEPSEVVLVEDCSNDGTLEYLEELRKHFPPDWIKILPLMINRGPGYARNAGWEAATQPYVAFLDADDAWHPEKLRIQYDWMCDNPEAVLVGHASIQLERDDAHLALTDEVLVKRISRLQLLLSNARGGFAVRTAMFHRNLSIRFDPSKRYMEDHWWLLVMAFSNYKIYKMPLPLAYTFKADWGESGLSGRLWEMEKEELDNYWRLQRMGLIARPVALIFTIFSLLKFFRRVIISATRRHIFRTLVGS
jgi:glycosyltransferase involved in cell wall biosynthesis